jgi:uncharacterized protein YbaR (Trm112 family)
MPLADLLIEVLVDPVDHGPLLYIESESVLYNPRRRVTYEVRGAIPVMLVEETQPVDDEGHARLASLDSVETGSAATT